MSTQLPSVGPGAIERSKKAAALTAYQIQLARDVCRDAFNIDPKPELISEVASVIASNYLAITTAHT